MLGCLILNIKNYDDRLYFNKNNRSFECSLLNKNILKYIFTIQLHNKKAKKPFHFPTMKTYQDLLQIVHSFHEMEETIAAAQFLIEQYGLTHQNFKGFDLREKAKPEFILMTTEGALGEPQIIRIPENTFEFHLPLMINLLLHEMIHVSQKTPENSIHDKNEREWQAYYEMLFHEQYPQVPELSQFHKRFFANKALEYYNRMGESTLLQIKYANQKQKIDLLLLDVA